MYLLLPDEPHIGFITLAVIFVSATLLGFASHSPGGLGVFDAAMLVALLAIRQGRIAGRLAAVPAAVLHHPVRARARDPGGREILEGHVLQRACLPLAP